VRQFCRQRCAVYEAVDAHDRDTVATFLVQLKDGEDTSSIANVACVTPEEHVVRQTKLKGLTVKFGAASTMQAFDALAQDVPRWSCWLRQHSLRVSIDWSQVDAVKARCENLGFRVRTDDKPRQHQRKVWSAEVAVAPIEAPVVVEDHFLICSLTPMTLKTIREVCALLRAQPQLDGSVCMRAIRIAFDDPSITPTGPQFVTPDVVTERGVFVALESQRAQKF
jgi:hypothetical protein